MEKIFERLDFVIKESNEILQHFHKTERNNIKMFCLCIVERLNFASESIKILANNFLSNTKVEYSCGIIIRSVLLDYLIILNAIEIEEATTNTPDKFHSELENYCTMMLCDNVRNTLKHFSALENQIPKQTLSNMYNNLVRMNPECFEEYAYDGTKPVIITNKYRSPEKLFQKLVTSKYMKGYEHVYHSYLFYSKYDHFGQMFYGLMRERVIDRLSKLDDVITEFPKILLFAVLIMEYITGHKEFVKNKREIIASFIDSFPKTKWEL